MKQKDLYKVNWIVWKNVMYSIKKINEFKPSKGYRDGIEQGKKNLARELSSIAEKHLKIEIREDKKNNKVSQKQFEKFMFLMNGGGENDD